MKILLLCNKSPYPAREGGPIAMNMIIEGLIRAGHSVKVLSINSNKYFVEPESIPEEYRLKTGIELVYVDLTVRPLAAFLNLFSRRSFHVERFISRDFERTLIRILHEERFDIVQFEMLYMSPYAEIVRMHSEARLVLRTHNIEHRIWSRIADSEKNLLKRIYLRYLSGKLRHYETNVLRQFDGIAAITENDAEFFRSCISSFKKQIHDGRKGEKSEVPVISVPFGIDPARFPESPEKAEFPSLFSIGSMDWIPNVVGIRWFLEKVWPEVHQKYPELRYYIAGRHMPAWLREREYPGVVVVGEVDDAISFMRSKSILIVPLFSGSGIRIKIIEGMAAGRTIVSTSIGAEGIRCTHGRDILIADSRGEFIRSISACVKDKVLCETLGTHARRLALTEYDRDRILSNLLAFYQKIGD